MTNEGISEAYSEPYFGEMDRLLFGVSTISYTEGLKKLLRISVQLGTNSCIW